MATHIHKAFIADFQTSMVNSIFEIQTTDDLIDFAYRLINSECFTDFFDDDEFAELKTIFDSWGDEFVKESKSKPIESSSSKDDNPESGTW